MNILEYTGTVPNKYLSWPYLRIYLRKMGFCWEFISCQQVSERHFLLLPSSWSLLKMWVYEQNLILDTHLALRRSHQWTWRSTLTKTVPWQKDAAVLKSPFTSELINMENGKRHLLFMSKTYFLRDNNKTEPAWTHNHQIRKLEMNTGKCSSGAFHFIFRGRRVSCLSFRVCFFPFLLAW